MRKRNQFTEEFKKDAVRLVQSRGAQTVAEVADRLGVSKSMLHRWRKTYEVSATGASDQSQHEREKVEGMRRRRRELEAENRNVSTRLRQLGEEFSEQKAMDLVRSRRVA